MVTRLRVIGAVLIGGLAAAGCAIPTQSVPSAIPPNKVPFQLLNPQLPTTTTTLQSSVPVKIYLLGPNRRLVGESRVVAFPAPLKQVVAELLLGPIRKEERAGITTAIPNDVRVASAKVSKTSQLATVDFNQAFGQIAGSDTPLAVEQVVFTVVAQTSVPTGVVFEIDGQTIPVPVGNNASQTTPVYLSQYGPNAAT